MPRAIALLVVCSSTLAAARPEQRVVRRDVGDVSVWLKEPAFNGELLAVDIDSPGCVLPEVDWLEKPFRSHPIDEGLTRALLPVPLDTEPGHLTLVVRCGIETVNVSVWVERYGYPKSELRVDPKFTRKPPERAANESEKITEVLSKSDPRRLWTEPFLRPATTKMTSRFGVRRMFNEQLKSRHRGIDLDGPAGKPVYATNDGVVALNARGFFYVGNAVFIDHGQDLFSMYFHLSESRVEDREVVKRGQLLGLMGRTGRVTGPHVHFATKLAGYYVNPIDFLRYEPRRPLRAR